MLRIRLSEVPVDLMRYAALEPGVLDQGLGQDYQAALKVFIAELTTTPAVIFRHKPKFRTNKPYMRGSEWHRARMTAPEFSSASADAGVRRPGFHARLLSEYQNQYSNHLCSCQ